MTRLSMRMENTRVRRNLADSIVRESAPREQNAPISTTERPLHTQIVSTELCNNLISMTHLATPISFVRLCITWRWGERGIRTIPRLPGPASRHVLLPLCILRTSSCNAYQAGVAWGDAASPFSLLHDSIGASLFLFLFPHSRWMNGKERRS